MQVVPVDTLDGDAPSSVAASEASATSSGARQALNLPTYEPQPSLATNWNRLSCGRAYPEQTE